MLCGAPGSQRQRHGAPEVGTDCRDEDRTGALPQQLDLWGAVKVTREESPDHLAATEHFPGLLLSKTVARFLTLRPRSLRELHVVGCDIGDEGVTALAQALACAPALEVLNLAGAWQNTHGAQALSEALRRGCDALQTLTLFRATLGEAGAIALAEALPCSHLRNLSLRACACGEQGTAALLAALPACTSLRVLSLALLFDSEVVTFDVRTMKEVCLFDVPCGARMLRALGEVLPRTGLQECHLSVAASFKNWDALGANQARATNACFGSAVYRGAMLAFVEATAESRLKQMRFGMFASLPIEVELGLEASLRRNREGLPLSLRRLAFGKVLSFRLSEDSAASLADTHVISRLCERVGGLMR